MLHLVFALATSMVAIFSCNSQEQNTHLYTADSIPGNGNSTQSKETEIEAQTPIALSDSHARTTLPVENSDNVIQVKSSENTTGLSNSFTDEKTITGSSGMSGYVSSSSAAIDYDPFGRTGSGKTKDELNRDGDGVGNLEQNSNWYHNFANYKISAQPPTLTTGGAGIIKFHVSIDCYGKLGVVEYGLSGTTYSGTAENMKMLVDSFLKNATFTKIGDTCSETALVTLNIK